MTADTNITVRPIVASDARQWRALWQAYLVFYDTELPDDTYHETLRRILAGDAGMYGFLATAGDTAIGLVHYLYHQNFWKPGQTCYLQDLFTTPDARGKGVARALMQAVFSTAAKNGIPDVYWLTAETNYAGRTLYDKLGVKIPFVVYETTT